MTELKPDEIFKAFFEAKYQVSETVIGSDGEETVVWKDPTEDELEAHKKVTKLTIDNPTWLLDVLNGDDSQKKKAL